MRRAVGTEPLASETPAAGAPGVEAVVSTFAALQKTQQECIQVCGCLRDGALQNRTGASEARNHVLGTISDTLASFARFDPSGETPLFPFG